MEIRNTAPDIRPDKGLSIEWDHIKLLEYNRNLQKDLLQFLENCMPESGRTFEPLGRHQAVNDIPYSYDAFWYLTDGGQIIGTVAVKSLSPDTCELKMMYLYSACQGKGLVQKLLTHAIRYSAAQGYRKMFLDTTQESRSAISLYQKNGFHEISRYNNNPYADVFMLKDLC